MGLFSLAALGVRCGDKKQGLLPILAATTGREGRTEVCERYRTAFVNKVAILTVVLAEVERCDSYEELKESVPSVASWRLLRKPPVKLIGP